MHGAAVRVASQPIEVEGLRHHSLRGECCVTVDQDRDRDPRVEARHGFRTVRLLCASPPLDHRVHGLQV